MLAFSVREALRQAAAAFGPSGVSVELASPATPEAVFWALDTARSKVAPAPNGHRPRPSEQVLEAVPNG
jgi:xanthine dehydrogenase large subunit